MPQTSQEPQIAAAVERFLATRGVGSSAQSAFPSVAASVVDRFLDSKRGVPSPVSPASSCSACAVPVAATPPEPAQPAQPVSQPEEPPVDFVCEADVRQVVHKSGKIRISTKTIVTPAARELAGQHDVFIMVAAPVRAAKREGGE